MISLSRMARSTVFALALLAFHQGPLAAPAWAENAPPPATAAPAAPAAPAAAPDPATLAAAIELMEVIGAAKNFDNMVGMLKKHVTSAAADEPTATKLAEFFDKLLVKFSTYKKPMMDETAAIYAKKFTAAELKQVTEFYKSGPGTKFIAEMPALMEEAGGIGQKYAVQMMKDLKEAKDVPAP